VKYTIFLVILILSFSVFSQSKDKITRTGFDKILAEQSKYISECERKTKEAQLKEFGKVLPKIAGECEWGSNGCPISIVKPIYPDVARKNNLFGMVEVEIIINEKGKVVFAKAIKGKKIFYRNAEKAAFLSTYTPKIFCGKAVWQRKFIAYNFRPN
jgi:hypothetical protein